MSQHEQSIEPDGSAPNGRPVIHMVGNAHLDPAWMWQWGEGMEAFIATCRSALERMRETPDFIFTCGSAAQYRWIEEVEPELFEAIRARVHEGRWNIVGGWWVQADCNLPSGEGFVRQALLGQRYFLEKFGRIARTGYSPDAFGHSLGLPQLLAGAGMTGYIYCRPDPTELHLPSPLVRWHGPDGSSVLAYRVPFHYNMYQTTVPRKVADLLRAFGAAGTPADAPLADAPLAALAPEWMLFYGVGNHGGGPTREQIAQIIAINEDPAGPTLRFSTPDAFFERASAGDFEIPDRHDDLQLNAPGCYSAHSEIKRLNRASEHALSVAERFSALASLLLGTPYPAEELREAWRCVCFNHFHDILCGVAIEEALADAIESYGYALSTAKRATRHALQRLARGIDTRGPGLTLVLFNPHSWRARETVTFELWHDIDKTLWAQPVHVRVTDDDGREIPCQLGPTSGKIGRDRIAVTIAADVPPMGWTCYRVHYGEASRAPLMPPIGSADGILENEHLQVTIDRASGGIASMLDKRTGREMLAGIAGEAIVMNDPTDTWGHGVERFNEEIGRFAEADMLLVENGPTHATIRTRSRWRASWIEQSFRLDRDGRSITASVRLFWAEQGALMKLAFPARADGAEALYESAYTVTRKPCDDVERPGGSWAAVVGRAVDGGSVSGLAIANNAKHAYSARSTNEIATLMVTALRSPGYATHDPHPYDEAEPHAYLDQGMQSFTYRLLPITSADWLGDLHRAAALVNAPPAWHLESGHAPAEPELPRTLGNVGLSPDSVVVAALKQAEDGSGWILRLYETSGHACTPTLTPPGDMRRWNGTLDAHGLATIFLRNDSSRMVNLIELPIDVEAPDSRARNR